MLYQFGGTLLRFLNRFLRQRDRSALRFNPFSRTFVAVAALYDLLKSKRGAAYELKTDDAPQTFSPEGESDWSILSDYFKQCVIPAVYVALGLSFIAVFAMLKPKVTAEGIPVGEFGQLPVVSGGRPMPIDTLARFRLMNISDRQTFKPVDPDPKDDEEPKSLPAIQWLLDMAARPEVADTHPVFRIENDELTRSLGMEVNEGRAYAFNDFKEATERLLELAKQADGVPKEKQTVLQRKQIDLFRRVRMYHQVKDWFFDPWRQGILAAVPDLAKDDASREMRMRAAELLARQMQETRGEVTENQFPLVIPTQIGAGEETIAGIQKLAWETYPIAAGHYGLEELIRTDHSEGTVKFQSILNAWKEQDPKAFRQALDEYETLLAEASEEKLEQGLVNASFGAVEFEEYFNRFAPFNALSWVYLGVFLATLAGWVLAGLGKPGAGQIANRSGLWLAIALLLIHTWAIGARIYISGKPPVTNLYSSAIFIGWAAVLAGIIVEGVFRLGFGNVVAAVSGFATLRIAYGLMGEGDTLGVLEPVLDTNFWLATHVVCITLGYAATYAAGLLGMFYILRGNRLGLLTLGALLLGVAGILYMRGETLPTVLAIVSTVGAAKALGLGIWFLRSYKVNFEDTLKQPLIRVTYGTLCAATILSFVGTVLGGLWADDSWGRFWGWDPKENGALIIVLWNALILHARWDGLVRSKGLAVLAVLGNIVVSWSWFGVNELGVGLHAYGFTEGRLFWLAAFCLSQLAIAAIGCLPRSMWWKGQSPSVA
jgi:ABC-type transport system involved in cytochrome c biogenesis permease subunit